MGWFGRDRHDDAVAGAQSADDPVADAFDGVEDDDGLPLHPVLAPLGDAELSRIADALAALEAEGVAVDDPASLSAGYDRAFEEWSAAPEGERPDPAGVVERYAIGMGEHLNRHTDLDWRMVTDVFGTDLAVVGGFQGSFAVVPDNLVAARWMRGETGWIPGVVGHLVAVRRRHR